MASCVNQLFEVECADVVHVGKRLVFATHTPDEGVVACANTAVDGPTWGNYRLLVVHDDVASFLLGAHQVEHNVVCLEVKVHVHFHTSFVSVARHCVPTACWIKFCHTHGKLATLANCWVNKLVDNAFVEVCSIAHCNVVCAVLCDVNSWVRFVRWATVDVEFGRVSAVVGTENNFLGAKADVHTFLVTYCVLYAIQNDNTIATDVDNAHFASFKEVVGCKFLGCAKNKVATNWHCATGNDAVLVRVRKGNFVGNKYLFDEVVFAKCCCIVVFGIFWMVAVTDVKFHCKILPVELLYVFFQMLYGKSDILAGGTFQHQVSIWLVLFDGGNYPCKV